MTLRAVIWIAVSTKPQANEDEKVSLPKQEADARAICAKNGWRVIEVLRVPGHSREYIDIHDCNRDMLTQGIDAFEKLLRHWDACDFDILVCRDSERFARTQTLHSYVVERTVSIGAKIFSLADGFVDEQNYRMFIAMAGYKAASDIDRLRKAQRAGLNARLHRGLPISSRVPASHTLVRDANTGKAIDLIVDESKRRLWDDAAHLLVDEGIGWMELEGQLYERFGHVGKDGKPYKALRLYELMTNPMFWGHAASHFRNAKKKIYRGLWRLEPGHAIPAGVTIHYDVYPAVYEGEQSERVKAELRRRDEIVRGKASPTSTLAFSGLFVCAQCNYPLIAQTSELVEPKYHCVSRYRKLDPPTDCEQSYVYLRESEIQTFFHQALERMLEAGTPEAFLPSERTKDNRIELLDEEIEVAEKRVRRLIQKQVAADEAVQDIYADEIQSASEQITILRRARDAAYADSLQTTRDQQDRQQVYAELAEIGLAKFWELPRRQINQYLHRLMGKRRLLVLDGHIGAPTLAKKNKPRYKGI